MDTKDPKSDLENDIREAYEIIAEYEREKGLTEDPIKRRRCQKRIDEQWEQIDGWLPGYLRICQQLRRRPPADIHQIIILRQPDLGAQEWVIPQPEPVPTAPATPREPKEDSSPTADDLIPSPGAQVDEAVSEEKVVERPRFPELHQILASHFDLEELRTLCADLGVRYDDLRGEGNAAKARELVSYLERRGRVIELVERVRRARPDIAWDIADVEEPDTVLVPAGPFWLGSLPDDPEASDNEKPRRQLHRPDFRIGRYPVTNLQYAYFVLADGHPAPEHWCRVGGAIGIEDHPVVNVSYEDAEAYCHWLGRVTGQDCRLPTEEDWEKAARGGMPETRRYPWGNGWQPNFCNTRELNRKGTTSVREFEFDNRSPFGAVDMAGNVWEWTSSWYKAYPGSTYASPKYGETHRVARGGSWQSHCRAARVSCRGRRKPDERRSHTGFRVAFD